MLGALGDQVTNQAAAVVAVLAQSTNASPENPAPLYALAAAIGTLAGALALVGKWMMGEITRLNGKLLDTAVPAMQASTIATNNMVEVGRQLSLALAESERERARLELELDQVRRRRREPDRHGEGE
jgi:hypothetical protein